ncbi:MAG: DUF2848 domain-containing protein [Synergistaceae bacterium]|jgi:hypothetical protein|nr:DUF2848 domain-containing protein [Synergistaceae bacterium]
MKHEATVLRPDGKAERRLLTWDLCVAIDYAGCDQKAVRAHVDERVKPGFPRPHSIPALYWIDPNRVSSREHLWVTGESTSGEAEVFLARDEGGDQYVTLAGGHTDRALEKFSVSKAKQICDRILAPVFWKVSDLREHWNRVEISSEIPQEDGYRTYQKGTLGDLLPPERLEELAREDAPAPGKVALFSGAPATLEGVVFAGAFRLTLSDPVLNRAIRFGYRISVLPDRH